MRMKARNSASRIVLGIVAFVITYVLLQQDIRLVAWHYVPFSLSSTRLQSDQVGVLLVGLGLLTASVFGFGVFTVIQNKSIAVAVTITTIGISVLGYAVFRESWAGFTW